MNACQRLIIDNMVLKAAEMYDIQPVALTEKNKQTQCCIARGLVWTVCKVELSITYRAIGNAFNRDHTTIYNSVDNIKRELQVFDIRQNQYSQLKETIKESLKSNYCR